ncbi:hypothetical protein IRP63_07235 [Clostridium botulinum]|uniref:Uncharacterized protein n=2 Tax=Clostridium botulinum TaxID=1491 RepID=A0A0A0ILY4_CLOBO|nr:hypothetical protein [Clostridium botulinum]KGN01978.1 hypothetical protein Z955_00715 [Clostridium botulinum C/D str. DC5]KEI07069.1 hypothetical protein Z952_02190 [Clostridium botulinum C/D str. BKT75002]KEI12146.1 hypothetical protein Z954_06335 [Clostridium botulinum C/D str. BKT2873]KOC48630.1 hypothetical protein ADU88_08250 [Clostridium botulinum]KOC55709.1 hypothetical protein ADU89_04575 [Clostridium botulinum]
MIKKMLLILIFIISFASLIISIKLFWNTSIFVDEYNLTPSIVDGGDFWLLMDWFRLLLLLLLSIVSCISIFIKPKQ